MSVCPGCGRCSHCGHSPVVQPYYPYPNWTYPNPIFQGGIQWQTTLNTPQSTDDDGTAGSTVKA